MAVVRRDGGLDSEGVNVECSPIAGGFCSVTDVRLVISNHKVSSLLILEKQ